MSGATRSTTRRPRPRARCSCRANASAAARVPAVVLVHGAAGVQDARDLTYGRQLAAMGVAALSVDAFASRRDRASSFVERLIEITEAMLLADAYSALHYLAARPDIDARHIALVGFSYGGMVTLYAAQALVAERYAPDGLRFAGHAAFYAPCIARFDDKRATGAPVLMLMGGKDELVDKKRCAEVAQRSARGRRRGPGDRLSRGHAPMGRRLAGPAPHGPQSRRLRLRGAARAA